MLFSLIYLINRLITRLISSLTCFQHTKFSSSKSKVSHEVVISSSPYEFHRPIHLLYRSDSLFSNSNFTSNNEPIKSTPSNDKLNVTINPYSTMIDQNQQSKVYLLQHYLKTYNPLDIDLYEANVLANVKEISSDNISIDTKTSLNDNCYPISCTNKQKIHKSKRYIRLKEQDNCSASISFIDERPSSCSTKLTSTILPVVMITDCSNSQRLHTDIIEMNENE